MALEDLTGSNKFISNLVASNPTPTDGVVQGDDHIRGIKQVLLNSFPFVTGANKSGLPGQPLSVAVVTPAWQAVTAVNPAQGNFNVAPVSYTPKSAGSIIHALFIGFCVATSTPAGAFVCSTSITNAAGGAVLGQPVNIGLNPVPAGGVIIAPLSVIGSIAAPTLTPINFNLTGNLNVAGNASMTGVFYFLECAP